MSYRKVFSFTPDYEYFVDADEIIKGGTGYAIVTGGGVNGMKKIRMNLYLTMWSIYFQTMGYME